MSNKALLVMDMPESCVDCQFCYEYHEGIEACCTVTREPSNDDMYRIIKEDYCQDKSDWCPLKPLPYKMKVTGLYNGEYFKAGGKLPSYKIGWNKCIDEILEGCKDEND